MLAWQFLHMEGLASVKSNKLFFPRSYQTVCDISSHKGMWAQPARVCISCGSFKNLLPRFVFFFAAREGLKPSTRQHTQTRLVPQTVLINSVSRDTSKEVAALNFLLVAILFQ